MPLRLLLPCLALLAACASTPPPRSEARPTEGLDRKSVIHEVLPANLRIRVLAEGEAIRSASGVVIATEPSSEGPVGWVLTNAHVVAAAPEGGSLRFEVLDDGRSARLPAEVVAVGESLDWDLALLRVPGLERRPAQLIDDAELEIGDEVIAVGAPFGRDLSVSTGIVSQVGRDESGAVWELKTDAPIGYGASGGGIFRIPDGKLLAIVEGYRTAKVSFPVEGKTYSFDVPMPGETFGAPAAKVRVFLEQRGWGHLLERSG